MSYELDTTIEEKVSADELDMVKDDAEEDNHDIDPDSSDEPAPMEPKPKINVDDVLRELVDRKSKMQSYSHFNLDAAVAVSYTAASLHFFVVVVLGKKLCINITSLFQGSQ